MNDTQAIHAKMDGAAALIFAKDKAIVDTLWSDGFRLVGSEEGEMASNRDELAGLIDYIFAQKFRLRWRWDSRPVTVEKDMAWVFAEGVVEFVYDGRVETFPYRLVTLFKRSAPTGSGSDWIWRLYSGSEPVKPRVY
jgi:hypothetical protein